MYTIRFGADLPEDMATHKELRELMPDRLLSRIALFR